MHIKKKYLQFLSKFELMDLYILLFQVKKGPRAANISWRDALWPCLAYSMNV